MSASAKRGASLQRRLTVVYGVSIVLIALTFLVLSTIFFAILSDTMNSRLRGTDARVDVVAGNALRGGRSLDAAAPEIIQKLQSPGVRVDVRTFDEMMRVEHREMLRPQPPSDRPFAGDSGPREGGPWHDNRINALHVFMSFVLGVTPRRHAVTGGMVILLPEPEKLGGPLAAYVVEMLALGVLVIGIAGAVGRALTMRAFAPIADVKSALEALASGDFSSHEVRTIEQSEIGDLTTAFNRAAARVSQAIEQREQDRARMRRFIADAGHELRTPLTVIMGHVDILRAGLASDPGTLERIYHAITAEGARMRTLVDNLNVLATFDEEVPVSPELFDVASLLGEILESSRPLDPLGRAQLFASEPGLVLAVRKELREAFSNLLENALKYAPVGPIEITVLTAGERLVIDVRDHGQGVDEKDLPHLFERFFRGSVSRSIEGSGLGLAIAARAVARARGTIHASNQLPHGFLVTIDLPCAPV